jgi:hypothetical protein
MISNTIKTVFLFCICLYTMSCGRGLKDGNPKQSIPVDTLTIFNDSTAAA